MKGKKKKRKTLQNVVVVVVVANVVGVAVVQAENINRCLLVAVALY